MAWPRLHPGVCLMPVEAEQRWARKPITQLTSAVHQSGYCRMLNGYFHFHWHAMMISRWPLITFQQQDNWTRNRSRFQETWPMRPSVWNLFWSFGLRIIALIAKTGKKNITESLQVKTITKQQFCPDLRRNKGLLKSTNWLKLCETQINSWKSKQTVTLTWKHH